MNIIKWNNLNSALPTMNRLDDLFDSMIYKKLERSQNWMPEVSIFENDKQYTVTLDIPGVEKKNLQLSISDGFMRLIAERKDLSESKNENHIWKEASVGRYERSFELPVSVDEDKIKAKFKNGVLNLIIPKENVVSEVKKITIN